MKIVSSMLTRTLVAPALFAGAMFAAAPAVLAQPAPAATPTGVRGTVTAFAGDTLKVRTRSGQDLDVGLTKDTAVRAVTLAKVDEIKAGSYIGSAAVPQADGSLKALEVHVFPPSMRGSGEGHRAWDLGKNSSMTNGTVGNVVVSNGRTITVKYPDGEKRIVIPNDVPIVNLEPGDRSLLVPGAHIVLFASKGADGALTARFISAGKQGVVPPM
ncbi:hypothetical protein OR16_26653 [Cupriavidus basilensis OR16]|uniref:DUF5666 domain-containing protein n=1 Tax=Cupriavidus basilensis OR16 TaxID=1127483 RepID=H1SB09_9BURK|nr:hypothetical protein [Cupriavidus basilensis]EHP40247.1 hypothetical protein OR16_26653 [Cupriavidus basilensis OR16]